MKKLICVMTLVCIGILLILKRKTVCLRNSSITMKGFLMRE